jgi:hypothetical protein
MQNGPNTVMSRRQPKLAASFAARSERWTSSAARPEPRGSQSAQRSYERYLALARAKALSGDMIGAENYYQHAEHYFRSISSDRGTRMEASPRTASPQDARSLAAITHALAASARSSSAIMGRQTGCTKTEVDQRVDGILPAIGYQRFVLTHYCPRRRAGSE